MWEMENLEGSEEREGTWNNTGEKLKVKVKELEKVYPFL